MHAVLLALQTIVAIGLIVIILLQRSEGGALGMGGGPGGLMSGRAAGNVLTRATTGLAVVFFVTCISLTIFSGAGTDGASVIDRIDPSEVGAPLAPADDLSDFLAPSGEDADEPTVPLDEPAVPLDEPE